MTTPQAESNDVAKALIDGALAAFRSNKGWADKAVAQLPDDKLHVALDPNTNCVAVVMKHVAGNLLSRWTDFLTTDGEKTWRNRPDLLNGAELTVSGDAPSFDVGDGQATVICSGVQTANATVYLIDSVLMPPAAG